MNVPPTTRGEMPDREAKFRIGPALRVGVFFGALAFLAVQLVGFPPGFPFSVRMVAGAHVALTTAIATGFAKIVFGSNDTAGKEVMSLPIGRTARPDHRRRSSTGRAA